MKKDEPAKPVKAQPAQLAAVAVAVQEESKKMAARESDYITEARTAAQQLWAAYLKLKSLQVEYNALDYGNTLDDGLGANTGITRQQVGSVVFDTTNAIETVFNAGHATNVAHLL